MSARDRWLGTFKCYLLSGIILSGLAVMVALTSRWFGVDPADPLVFWPTAILGVSVCLGVLPWSKYD